MPEILSLYSSLCLIRPLESCLDCSSSSSSDLPKVLKVYTIAHKYRACAIEERVKEIAVGLATPDDIRSHISPSLTAIHIYDTAIDVECEEIAGVLRGVIVEDSWGGKITPFDMLALGECFDDPEFLGLAHYQIVLLGRDVWSNSSHLTISHRDHLTTGLLNLYKEWDTVLKAWTSEDGIFHDCASLCGTGESLWKVYQRLNVDNLPSFNVIGRLKIIEMIRFDCDCAQRIPTLVKWKREEIERKLPDLFSLRGRK